MQDPVQRAAWRGRLRAIIAACLVLPGFAGAQSVALTGIMGDRALLVVDGAAPEVLSPGQARQGVKLVSAAGEQAVVEVAGKRIVLTVGAVPVRIGGAAGSTDRSRIVLTAGSGGHFLSAGQINGGTVRFMVDTGATAITVSATDAERLGLNLQNAQPIAVATAAGTVRAYRLLLDSVRLGGVELFNVEAVVMQAPMPYVLLGNSFLSRFRMSQENNQLVLELRY
jgi:aspartyl protease family protein